MRSARRAIAIVGLALALAGCKSDEERKLEQEPCPRFGVLGGSEHLVAYRPTGKDLTDVIYEASVDNVVGRCEFPEKGRVRLRVEMPLAIKAGPAAKGETIKVPYFIAVTLRDRTILQKVIDSATVTAPEDGRTIRGAVGLADFDVVLPERVRGRDLEVLVGLQLTPSQFDANQAGR